MGALWGRGGEFEEEKMFLLNYLQDSIWHSELLYGA